MPATRTKAMKKRAAPLTTSEACAKKATAKPSKGLKPAPITVDGVKLQPTVVFDTFWRWCAERKSIDDKRRAGLPPPWTENKHLRDHRFCNPYRVADRASQFFIKNVVEKGSQEPEDVIFRVLLYQTFTKAETFTLLEKKIKSLTWSSYKRSEYMKVLDDARVDDKTLYTGSYQKPAPKFVYDTAHEKHLMLLEMFMERDIVETLTTAKYLADIYDFIATFPGMGPFASYQLLICFTYTDVIHFNPNDFVVAGCGAQSGLEKMFGKEIKQKISEHPSLDVNIMRWMVKSAPSHFERLGLEFAGLGPDNLPLDIQDIEHAICETDKYARLVHPEIKGKSTKCAPYVATKAAKSASATKLILPKAWSNPARCKSRIRPGPPAVVEKLYLVESITDRRVLKDGQVQYKVRWKGYDVSASSWEPEEGLVDAKESVNDYLRAKKLPLWK